MENRKALGAAPSVKNATYTLVEELKESIQNDLKTHGTIPARLILMIGGADFFEKGKRTNPYELLALVNYLNDIQANNPADENEFTYVLAFDPAYTDQSIKNDAGHVNQSIYSQRKEKGLTKESIDDDIGEHMDEYIVGTSFGNVLFNFYAFELPTRYRSVSVEETYYPYLNGKTPVTTMADQCIPQEGSVMKAIQELCMELPFHTYYLYNCAWIGGFHNVRNASGTTRGTTAKRNRHYESMCELLYIFQHLGKPSYLLTAKPMSVFKHPRKILGSTPNSLNLTPLNETTQFKEEVWVPIKIGGRTIRKTRNQTHSRPSIYKGGTYTSRSQRKKRR